MKRYCKHVDITNLEFIESAVFACLKKSCKRKRNDTVRLFAWILNCRMKEARKHLQDRDSVYADAVHVIALHMQHAIIAGNIELPHVTIKYRADGNSGKRRKITVQHIWQLLYDHVAVMAMEELNKLLSARQVSGRKGMGLARGYTIIRKWFQRHTAGKLYYAKMDICHYYESVDIDKLCHWLLGKIKNDKLMTLISSLLHTGEAGLNIGSYLSHFVANLYLSDLWHKVSEQYHAVKFAFFYMDDMLFIGSNKRKLKRALDAVIGMLHAKGLSVKPKWQIHRITHEHAIDILGYRFARATLTLRKRIFRRARRSFLRVARLLRHAKTPARRQLCRAVSYYGWIKKACLTASTKASLLCAILPRIKNSLAQSKLCLT